MPSRQNAARIDSAVWQSYRKEIFTHYMQEDNSLNDLISYMKEKNNFYATKPQYERQLASWKFRKNLTSEEWGFAINRVVKRKRDGKETALFVEGFKIPTKRVKKEMSRHGLPNKITASEQVQAPEGISVRTPQAHTASCPAFNISPKNLPWIKFQNYIESQVSIGHALSFGSTSGQGQPSLAQPGTPTPDTEMLSILGTTVSALVRQVSGLTSTVAERDLVRNIPSIFQLPAATLESQGGMTLHGSANQHPLLHVFKSILYSVSNNLRDGPGEKFLRLVIESKQESVLASLFKEKIPTIEAFSIFTFRYALSTQDTNLLRICLQAGVDPNLPVPPHLEFGQFYTYRQYRLYTPLEISIYHHGNIELAKVLLDAGAHTHGLLKFSWETFFDTAISALSAHFSMELAKLLLDISADINATGCWGAAVLTAAAMSNVEPIQTLLKVGLSVRSIVELGEIALTDATVDRNIELVQILLELGVDINAFHTSRGTALEVATAHCHIELVQILLDAGANVNAAPTITSEGSVRDTVLQTAAEEGNIELVRILLDAGANVNAPPSTDSGKTALQAAAENGNIELVRILLDAGANVNTPPSTGRGNTALQAAAKKGNIELVQILLDAGANVNAPPSFYGGTALQAAAGAGSIELVRILLHVGADVNTPFAGNGRRTALRAAAEASNIEVVQILLDAGADVSGGTALRAAAEAGNIEVIRILLDAGAGVNGGPALHAAAEASNIEVVRILLHAGAGVDGGTALEAAAGTGNAEVVRTLLDAGADVNDNDNDPGRTALASAMLGRRDRRNVIELVQILLDAGADPRINFYDALGGEWTILSAAVEGGNIEVVRALLDAGADVNAESEKTALQEAVDGNRIELVQLLLDAGADANTPPPLVPLDSDGAGKLSALQSAAGQNNMELVRILLDAGADINAPAAADRGRTALQAAVESGNTEMVQYFLLNENADVNAPAGHQRGITALQAAAIRGDLDLAILLLNAGADVTAAPAMLKGRSALEGAAEHGRLDMVQLLLDASTDTRNPGGRRVSEAAILAEGEGHYVVAKLLRDYSD